MKWKNPRNKKDLKKFARKHQVYIRKGKFELAVQKLHIKFKDEPEYKFLMLVFLYTRQSLADTPDWSSMFTQIDDFMKGPDCKQYMRSFLSFYAFSCLHHLLLLHKQHPAYDETAAELTHCIVYLPKKLRRKALKLLPAAS